MFNLHLVCFNDLKISPFRTSWIIDKSNSQIKTVALMC